jgi:hypothetical protein
MSAVGLLPQGVADAWLKRNTVPRVRQEHRRWIECNLYYFNSLTALRQHFPDARFVHVIRHPKDFCQSHIRWERQRLQSRIANQLVPFWAPVGYHEQLLGLLGQDHQRVRYYAKVWARRNTVILRQLAADPTTITIRFEDIFESPQGAERLAGLLRDLGMQATTPVNATLLSRRVNETSATRGAPRWDSRCDSFLRRYCGALMERFGYILDG